MARRFKTPKIKSVASTIKKPKVKPVYQIDRFVYKSKPLMDAHIELKALKNTKLIKSFSLPTIEDAFVKSKFKNYKAEVDGFTFDSLMESKFYTYLLQEKKDSNIAGFEMQVAFELQEKFTRLDGKHIRAIAYVSDFVVEYLDGTKVVIDVKGQETPDFLLKKKMFENKYRHLRLICVQYQNKYKEWFDLDDIKAMRKEELKAAKKEEVKKLKKVS